jgi:predicted ATP-grasp superfamily ATP-dependent carboligase
VDEHLLIFGASVRAAAFSALRAGLRPWCADLFADADLRSRCAALALKSDDYPRGFLEVSAQAPLGPWMYTGALENQPRLVRELSQQRPLWGNSGKVLKRVRSPGNVARILGEALVLCPAIHTSPWAIPPPRRWLRKPLASAGGRGVHFWTGPRVTDTIDTGFVAVGIYLQEYVEGQPCAAVYVGEERRAQLLGVTRQLVGEDWLHATPFHYCGSIGPCHLDAPLRQRFEQVGNVLSERCALQGLFGVDCILRDGVPWPVEVNPRYTASVEVLEYAAGVAALALHRKVFDPNAPTPSPPATDAGFVGKAILFARDDVVVPGDGPWSLSLEKPGYIWEMPLFADIPHDGQAVKAGRPILTFFARGDSAASCLDTLKQIAADLDHWLFAR